MQVDTQWRKVQDRLEDDERCSRLEKFDRLEIFQEYIRDLEKEEDEHRKIRKVLLITISLLCFLLLVTYYIILLEVLNAYKYTEHITFICFFWMLRCFLFIMNHLGFQALIQFQVRQSAVAARNSLQVLV